MKTQTDKNQNLSSASVASDSPNPTTRQALRVLGPFAKQNGYYFRVVWPTCSRVLHSKSFKTANRWSAIIQRRIAEASAI